MKPSHIQTPRQLSDCYFETGHSFVSPMTDVEARGHSVLFMVCVVGLCVVCGLVVAGVI